MDMDLAAGVELRGREGCETHKPQHEHVCQGYDTQCGRGWIPGRKAGTYGCKQNPRTLTATGMPRCSARSALQCSKRPKEWG